MFSFVVILVGALEAAGGAGFLYSRIAKSQNQARRVVESLEAGQESFIKLRQEMESLFSQMVDLGSLKTIVDEYRIVQESVKAERGRITITQAELETVEARSRELEEIERELEASALEAKEELNILKRKEDSMRSKNDSLKDQISATTSQMDEILSELQLSAQMQEQIDISRSQLIQIEQQLETLLLEIEKGNEQYLVLKKRYDALDIEYAQLYEKFSEAEAMISSE